MFNPKRENIVFVLHKAPDADAVASAYIVLELIKQNSSNKKFYFLCDHEFKIPFPEHLTPKSTIKPIKNKDLPPDSCVYVLDHSDPEFSLLKDFEDPNISEMIIIDHHFYYDTGKKWKTKTLINDQALSTCEVLYDYLKPNQITKDIATAIYIGMFSDSLYWQTPLKEKQFKDINDLITKYGVEVDKNKLYLHSKYFLYKKVISEMIFLHSNKSKRSNTVTFIIPRPKLEKCKMNFVSIPHLSTEAMLCAGVQHVIVRYEFAPGVWSVRITTKDVNLIKDLTSKKIYRPNQHWWSNLSETEAKRCVKNLRDKLTRWENHKEPIHCWENIWTPEKGV